MKNQITFEEYEELIERLEKIGVEPEELFPSPKELNELMDEDIKKELPFLIWLAECNERGPKTPDERESMKYIKKLLYEHLTIK